MTDHHGREPGTSSLDESVSAWVDGELSREESARVQDAITRDPALAERAEGFRTLDAALRGLEAPPVPKDLAARIQQKLSDANGGDVVDLSVERRLRMRRFAPVAAALAAGLAAMLMWTGGEDTISSSPLAQRTTPGERAAPENEGFDELAGDELEIALELDGLDDFEVSAQLEVLELLVALDDEAEGIGS